MNSNTEMTPFERRPDESAKALPAFDINANQGRARSLAAVGQELGKGGDRIKRRMRLGDGANPVHHHLAPFQAETTQTAQTIMSKRQEETPGFMPKELRACVHPDADKIVVDTERGTCTLSFRYPYEIDLDRIQTQGNLLGWVRHLAGKPWMNRERLGLFIDAVVQHKGFRIQT